MKKPTVQEIFDVLDLVNDPEIGIPITHLGLVYEVIVEDDLIRIDFTLTFVGCPLAEEIEADIRMRLEPIKHTENIQINQVWNPPWDPSMMSDEGRLEMGYPI